MWASSQISSRNYERFVRDARDYALLNGLVIRYDYMSNDNCVGHIPFTLFPSPYPKRLYEKCLKDQLVVNKLMLKIANDITFMNDTLRPIAQVDDFTRHLLEINDLVSREGLAQPITCCINRADYMLDTIPDTSGQLRARQVEVNAIASSMSAHSSQVTKLQEFLLAKYGVKKPDNAISPENKSLKLVAGGLIEAFDSYQHSASVILLVNEERSNNFSDQLMIELQVTKTRPDIRFVRRSFRSLPEMIKLGPNKELILEETLEVAVVYFRYCYDPSQYNFDQAWDVRLLLERSKAIKCPSINFHLSGAKKFQQVLDSQTKLERFLEPTEAKRLESLFCKFWSFGSDLESNEAYKVVMSESTRLVLKPQREGGGHNIYGEDVRTVVQRMRTSEERSKYILMEYINAPREKNWILVHEDNKSDDSSRMEKCDQLVSELGIFGSILADAKTSVIKCNKSAGYLVRSKKFGVNEGGVATGFAGISNLILVDNSDSGNESSFYHEIVTN